MKCPKCQSKNINKLQSRSYQCQNCQHIFEIKVPKNLPFDVSKINKKTVIIGSSIVVLITGIGLTSFFFSKRDPYVCYEKQIKEVTEKFEPILRDWDDAEALASSTSRINLAIPVSKLQNIQKETRNLELPFCGQPVLEYFLDASETNIESYLLFMQDEDDDIIREKMSAARGSQKMFITSYSRLQKGESTEHIKVLEAMVDNIKQDLENLNSD